MINQCKNNSDVFGYSKPKPRNIMNTSSINFGDFFSRFLKAFRVCDQLRLQNADRGFEQIKKNMTAIRQFFTYQQNVVGSFC